jgi:hypothetical protein
MYGKLIPRQSRPLCKTEMAGQIRYPCILYHRSRRLQFHWKGNRTGPRTGYFINLEEWSDMLSSLGNKLTIYGWQNFKCTQSGSASAVFRFSTVLNGHLVGMVMSDYTPSRAVREVAYLPRRSVPSVAFPLTGGSCYISGWRTKERLRIYRESYPDKKFTKSVSR